ncbi:error-prone DNA polymerase [soil metagenome]
MGASHPDEMVLRAKQLGYRGLGLCDVNGLYGVVRGFQAAEKPNLFDATHIAAHEPTRGFRYHVGSELTPFDSSPVTLLPISKEGYSRLSRLITRVKRPAAKGRLKLSLDDILEEAGHASGELIAIPLPPWNMKQLEKMADAFGDRLYLPVHKDSTWESIALAREAMAIEKRLGPSGLRLFATQRPLFHIPQRKPLHDVLTCIHHSTTLDLAKTRLTQNSERYLRPLDELRMIYRDRPDLLDETVEMSKRLQFSLDELKYKYPQEGLPAGMTSAQHLRQLVEKGMTWRFPDTMSAEYRARARKQVEHELTLIGKLEYEDYFLTLSDICRFARERDILHQGRGSAANSIVCFALGLTAIDPIKLGLLFERFLSLERAEPPDIDIDFEHERREEVIQYIYKKYGSQHAAMVCVTVCFRSRMAVREVAKAMGATLEQTDTIIKAMGREGLAQLFSVPFDIGKFGITEEKFRMILKLAAEIKGFPRHLGIHSGGFVISHEPIVDIVPVEAATMTDRYVIQWNKDDVNLLGLMKLDILSLGMLTAIRKALVLLKEKKNITHDLASIPQDCGPTYKMIQRADTVGVFQIESRAQMSLLPRLKPKEWYDLVVQVAIVRPGPIQGGLVHPYLKRRSGEEKIVYAHPKLIPILAKTMGVPIFQEQVMQIVIAVADFTPGEADELRRVVSSAWRKKAVMHGLRNRLINGMLANDVSSEYAEQIYKVIEGFSQYGFPESHAASFALLTYISCWLKQHHPDVFAVALVNSQPMGFYPPRQLIADAERHGVRFHALDVQHSEWDYTLEKPGHVRVGLRSIDGLGETDGQLLVQARQRGGPFRSVEDLVRRTRLPKKVLTRLATAGALFQLSPDPRQALFSLQGLDFNQQSFFYGTEPLGSINDDVAPDGRESIRTETEWEHVVREFRTKGFSLTRHPIEILRRQVLNHRVLRTRDGGSIAQYHTAESLVQTRNGAMVKLVGLRSLLQKPPTAKGVCFVSLEDETGIFNAIVMPDVYEKVRLVLYSANILEVYGVLQNHQGVIHVKAKEVRAFELPQSVLQISTRANLGGQG